MLENNLFTINKKLTEDEYMNIPSKLAIDVDLFNKFIYMFDSNFYRLGLNNSIKEIDQKEYQMNIYMFSPVDMLDFLEEYDKLNYEEKEKILSSIKNKKPGAWLSRNYIPLKNAKSLTDMKTEAYKHIKNGK